MRGKFTVIDEKGTKHLCEDSGQGTILHKSSEGKVEGWYGRWFLSQKLLSGQWDIRST